MKPSIFLLSFLTTTSLAQRPMYEAVVGPVKQAGYYRIDLSPDVLGRSRNELGDMRLHTSAGREVPYVLMRQTGSTATGIVAFEVAERRNVPNVSTTWVVRRTVGHPIQSLSIELKNTSVLKKATLSGGPDGKTWYALDEGIRLGNTASTTATSLVETVSFPLSDYAYFRLTVNDSTSAPLNILSIGSYGQPRPTAQTRYTAIPGLRFRQRDSSDQLGHYTYLFLDRPTPARLDRLTVRVRQPAQFRRQAELGQVFNQTVTGKRNRRRHVQSFRVH